MIEYKKLDVSIMIGDYVRSWRTDAGVRWSPAETAMDEPDVARHFEDNPMGFPLGRWPEGKQIG